ncbi:DEAD/DEAH box helicase [Oerskovia sp. NPDC060287]|uniref:DEAD/DEAH box helicase n=1 Tax=Oerskovia sp. NPDC060287 TaxID=3347095 RepID=UPI0036548661
MGLRDLLRARRMRPDDTESPMRLFAVSYDSDGANFVTTPEDLALLHRGEGQRSAQEQHLVLEMLAEQGAAYLLPNGFAMRSADVARLGDDEAEVLGLPRRLPGTLEPEVRGNTTSRTFSVTLRARIGSHLEPCRRNGPVLTIGTATHYRLSPRALKVICAVEHHEALAFEDRTETNNVRLVAELQAARIPLPDDPDRDEPFPLPLGHLTSWSTTVPDRVGLLVDEQPDGSLHVSPDLGPDVDPDRLASRWHQIEGDRQAGVLRVDEHLVLLDEQRLAGVRDVLATPRIPAERARDFLTAPGQFFDHELVDVELNFGVRVAGVGIIVPQTFADASESGISWFGDSDGVQPASILAGLIATLPQLDTVEQDVRAAQDQGRSVIAVGDQLVDISDRSTVDSELATARDRLLDETLLPEPGDDDPTDPSDPATPRTVQVGVHVADAQDVGEALRASASSTPSARPVDYASLLRSPYPHQREGIEWMVRLMTASLLKPDGDPSRVQGAILADDMGLGKTYMTLVALREFLEAQRARGGTVRPTLAVLPVSLIENWQAEIDATFATNPFEDVVVLQGKGITAFQELGRGKETTASVVNLDDQGMLRADAIRFSLKIGPEHGRSRLDMPGRLVLVTYETLASYQLSLAQVDWGAVVFDEAQTIKNPDALRTRAAKALKARFMLLATGTPVENKMLDFWCLMDAAQPGLLGSWAEFRTQWVSRIEKAPSEEKSRIGQELRELVGPFMLRRIKEDHLRDLPPKTVYGPEGGPAQVARPDLGVVMPVPQRDAYDAVLEGYRRNGPGVRGAALATVQALRGVSLHPSASGDAPLSSDPADLDLSARMVAAVRVIDEVRAVDEKVIVFVINKKVQARLALWLQERYRLRVRVVNGDTAAVGSGATRKGIIGEFERAPGFNVIIMSPLAVGVGLTIVGANHAIHLERHWNPAKEAQATDRIYRIGQTRPVHVYLPMALHPDTTSFDLNLDRLLQQKSTLRDAIVVPEAVGEQEVVAALGLGG